jgi:Cd2+/Zn2+-exporting ATPase
MCCGEEVGLLKAAVAPMVGGAERLSFDLLRSTMNVRGSLDAEGVERIRGAVAKTGMEAMPWADNCASGLCALGTGSVPEKNGRLFACLAGGLLTAAAFVSHALLRGDISAALVAESGTGVPTIVIFLYLAAVLTAGRAVLPKALYAARKLKPDMNLLMAVAILGAIVLGEWLEAASVSFLFSLALLLESWSLDKAKREISALLDITPQTARFICPSDGNIEAKPVGEIPVGSAVIVRPGERIPLDGVITRGASSVNQAPITGESAPVAKGPGSEVFAGTINEEGSIEFRSTRPASDTTLSRIIRMVEEGRSRRAPVELWMERFARIYTPVMMLTALVIATVPPLFAGGGWAKWFYEGLVVLVIACPCALVISTPVTIAAGLSSAARNGVLVKGGAYLEAPAGLKAIALDKTGTITFGQPSVKQVMPVDNHTENGLLANAAALETHSTHPLARAILRHVESVGVRPSVADTFTILPGQGAEGTIGGKTYWIGSHRMLERWQRETPVFHDAIQGLEEAGNSLMVMWCDDHICGLISVADQVRPEARGAVSALKTLGLKKVVMMSGDNQRAAELIAGAVGVDEFYPELLPEDKVKLVSEMKEKLSGVAMVGDGVNDAPAMAAASVGIAMGAMGSDAAIETADIALMSDDLSKIPWLIRHSRRTISVIRQNVVFSLLVKSLFVGLAAAGLATLWGAIAADMGASLIVIVNGLRLLRITGADGDTKYLAPCRSEPTCCTEPRF